MSNIVFKCPTWPSFTVIEADHFQKCPAAQSIYVVYMQGVPEKNDTKFTLQQFCNHTSQSCGFQQNVQKEIAYTTKTFHKWNNPCFAASTWTPQKQYWLPHIWGKYLINTYSDTHCPMSHTQFLNILLKTAWLFDVWLQNYDAANFVLFFFIWNTLYACSTFYAPPCTRSLTYPNNMNNNESL